MDELKSHVLDDSEVGYEVQDKKLDKITKPLTVQEAKQGLLVSPIAKLDTLEEESEYENKGLSTSNSSRSLVEELAGIDMKGEKQVNNIEHVLFFPSFWVLTSWFFKFVLPVIPLFFI